MLFFAEKNHCLYACQSSWDESATVFRIPCGPAGHVDGEQYGTNYTPRKMQILATHAEMIDLDREINVLGVQYRLDLQNLRIKHLAQAAKTTTTDSGKARKGQLSWQTFQKFELLGDLAYSWYELIGQSPDWRTLKPYVLARDITGDDGEPGSGIQQNGWTCPDCGAVNDADSGECSCGTTYDGPVEEGSGEVLEGEILPPVAGTVVLPALPADVAERVETIRRTERAAQEALITFAENVVRCGLELLALKKDIGHGKFLKFFEQNLAHKGFQERHARRYMEVAQAVKAKIAGKEGGMALLLSGDDSGDGEVQFSAIRETLADMTDARSWQQLWMDFGLLRSPVQRGGDHGGGAASAALAADSGRKVDARFLMVEKDWLHIIEIVREFVSLKKYTYLKDTHRQSGRLALLDAINNIPE